MWFIHDGISGRFWHNVRCDWVKGNKGCGFMKREEVQQQYRHLLKAEHGKSYPQIVHENDLHILFC